MESRRTFLKSMGLIAVAIPLSKVEFQPKTVEFVQPLERRELLFDAVREQPENLKDWKVALFDDQGQVWETSGVVEVEDTPTRRVLKCQPAQIVGMKTLVAYALMNPQGMFAETKPVRPIYMVTGDTLMMTYEINFKQDYQV